ncbi:MAG: hypothetical protein CL912_18435 [Deltaproteobacteria bacterium]|nr:hypothetical protein [Deltaproteobacteria bacterium]
MTPPSYTSQVHIQSYRLVDMLADKLRNDLPKKQYSPRNIMKMRKAGLTCHAIQASTVKPRNTHTNDFRPLGTLSLWAAYLLYLHTLTNKPLIFLPFDCFAWT